MPMTPAEYLQRIQAALTRGDATEHTHRSVLQEFIQSQGDQVVATNEPRRSACGAPDFIITRRTVPLGYVETKDVGDPLDRTAETEQLKRYRSGLGNLLLTDYIDFRWYSQGEFRLSAQLARRSRNGRYELLPDGGNAVLDLLTAFLAADVPAARSARELAERMAGSAKLIRATITRALELEQADGQLHRQLRSFREVLIHDLNEARFADMFSQTICYGLFAARINHRTDERFTRMLASHELPRTNPFLRTLFAHIAGPDLDPAYSWAVDDVAELLSRTDFGEILPQFARGSRRGDPVFHFYETFLASYDPAMREAMGVYYTPEPVVSYIIRSVDELLKTKFALDGLRDASLAPRRDMNGNVSEGHRLLILDPACGSGTFLYGVIDHIFQSFAQNRGMWPGYVRDHLLPRLFGFELLMAPYAVAHMKLGLQLQETGYDLNSDQDRLGVYLTNTLAEAHGAANQLGLAQWLADEGNAASEVKRELPIMVVLGNPPYSGKTSNPTHREFADAAGRRRRELTWSGRLLRDYYQVEGQPLRERNPRFLENDYVQFIRFAQWRIVQTGAGILGFITDNSYLDSPTFRGMRESLLRTFDEIYILDLHGGTRRGEQAPNRGEDDNVFQIQQGVAIAIFVKRPAEAGRDDACRARVFHNDLWAPQAQKLDWLHTNSVATTPWTEIQPISPFFLLRPQNANISAEFREFWSVTDAVPLNGWGVATRKDYLLVDLNREELTDRFRRILGGTIEQARALGVRDKKGWAFERIKPRLGNDVGDRIREYVYRPFDHRWTFYEPLMIERGDHRLPIARHFLGGNVNRSLLVSRTGGAAGSPIWDVVFAAVHLSDLNVFRRGGAFIFPLYVYPDERALLGPIEVWPAGHAGRRPNLSRDFVQELSETLAIEFVPDGRGELPRTFGPENVFDYIYALLHSPTYRSRYADPLRIDWPRIPLTSDVPLFTSLCQFGCELTAVHTMRAPPTEVPSYPVARAAGDAVRDVVTDVQYRDLNGDDDARVYINDRQYFEPVRSVAWTFTIGGYEVCQRWLSEREGRRLSYDEIQHYRNLVGAVNDTIRIMGDIDVAIDGAGGWPLT